MGPKPQHGGCEHCPCIPYSAHLLAIQYLAAGELAEFNRILGA